MVRIVLASELVKRDHVEAKIEKARKKKTQQNKTQRMRERVTS